MEKNKWRGEEKKYKELLPKIIQGLTYLPYKESLEKLNLQSLERWRMLDDLIEVFKFKGIDKGDIIKVLVLKIGVRTSI